MDQLVSLITNLATGNKDYVVFLGAGFSKDAGIMSGWEVLLETLKPLYILNKDINSDGDNKPTREVIENWYINNPELNDLGYSQILERIFPGEIERREYISSLFANKNPGDAHKELAKLVSMGLIRYIFTTNFDNLLEKALDEFGVDYDVIFSDDILAKSKSWDRVRHCRIYKLHGDYKVGAIKNTDSELQSLSPQLGDDFQYIIDRHGIIFIGYSGRDAGIMYHILNRKPYAYPIYWQIKDYPNKNKEFKYFHEIVDKYENTHTRPIKFINNPSASNFLMKIREGIEKLDLILKINKSEKEDFDSIVINSDEKRLRKKSLDIIEKFNELFESYIIKEDKDRNFVYKFEIFKELLTETHFFFHYLDSLARYNCDIEIEFLFKQVLTKLSAINNLDRNHFEFIRNSYPYYFIMTSGAILLKHEKESLLRTFWKIEIKYDYIEISPLVSIISYEGSGWAYIKNQIYKQNYHYAKYSIIRDHLRFSELLPFDIDYFDCYMLLSVLLVYRNYEWINGSSIYSAAPFMEVYRKYFKDKISTPTHLNEIIKSIKSKHNYLGSRSNNSFGFFINQLQEMLKNNVS